MGKLIPAKRKNFGSRIALNSYRKEGEKIALKVTIQHQEDKAVTLKIEGRVTGPNVPELDRAWQDLAPTLGSRKLWVDLRGVTFVDTTGRCLLAEIHDKTGAEFLADTPMIKHYAEEAKQSIRTNGK